MIKIFLFFILLSLFIANFVDAASFIRGDVNQDSGVDISDASFILNWLFLGGQQPRCMDAADVNDDGDVDISDSKYLFGFLFTGENGPPPYPYPQKGLDITFDKLGCRGEPDAIILNSCQTIDKPGNYVLANNVTSEGTCFIIMANEVTLDCRNNYISINYSGIHAIGTNSTIIKNCFIEGEYIPAENPGPPIYADRFGIHFDSVNRGVIAKNTIKAHSYNGHGIHLANSASIEIVNNNVTTAFYDDGSSIYSGIYLLNTSNSRILNNTIAAIGIELGYDNAHSIELDNSPINRIDSNVVRSSGGIRITMSDNVTISNNNVSNNISNSFSHPSICCEHSISLANSHYSQIINNSVITFGKSESSDGINLLHSSFAEIKNNVIETHDGGYGISLFTDDFDFGTLQNLNVITYDWNSGVAHALFIDGGNFIIRDSTFNASYQTIDVSLNGMINLTNVSFAEAIGTFNRHWYLDVLVKNTSTNLQGVAIRVYDKNNRLLTSQPTDIYGRIPRQTILSYSQTSEGGTSFTPHRIVVTKLGYKSQSRLVTLDQNRFETFTLQKI